MREGTVKIKYSDKLIGSFRFRIDLPRVWLSRPSFENPDAAPFKILSELREIVRRHAKEWHRDTRYSFIETEDRQIETEWRER